MQTDPACKLLLETFMTCARMRLAIFIMLCWVVCAPATSSYVQAASLQQSQRSGAELQATFQYLLSDLSGPVRSQWARLVYDPHRQELYTLDQSFNDVRVYNRQGMEIFAFGESGATAAAVDIAIGDNGRIYLLSRDFTRHAIQILDFRGEPVGQVALRGLPGQFRDFNPDRMKIRDTLFYLLDSEALRIVVASATGDFLKGYDLAERFGQLAAEQDPEKSKSLALEISGFGVGADGSVYFTAPTLFSAFRIDPDGAVDAFGKSGSGPGKFGVVSGIAADSQGNIYVADRLRSVVLVFSRAFVFQGEFGYRGDRPEDMVVPDDLAIDPELNRVFVAQAANKGVGVYQVDLRSGR